VGVEGQLGWIGANVNISVGGVEVGGLL